MYALSTNINEACLQIDAICKIELQQRPFSAKFELVMLNYKIESQPVFIRLNQIIFVKDQLKELLKPEDAKEIHLILTDLEPQKTHCPACQSWCLKVSCINIWIIAPMLQPVHYVLKQLIILRIIYKIAVKEYTNVMVVMSVSILESNAKHTQC